MLSIHLFKIRKSRCLSDLRNNFTYSNILLIFEFFHIKRTISKNIKTKHHVKINAFTQDLK